jgi:hypothetical protein
MCVRWIDQCYLQKSKAFLLNMGLVAAVIVYALLGARVCVNGPIGGLNRGGGHVWVTQS